MSRLNCEAADEQTNEHAARIAEKSRRWGEIVEEKTEQYSSQPDGHDGLPRNLGGRVGFRDQKKNGSGGDRADC